jgi:hypothetical protein
MFGRRLFSSTTASALSRKTSAVKHTTGGLLPFAWPARNARSASLPETASIQISFAAISRRTFVTGQAFIANRACTFGALDMNRISAMRWRMTLAS